MSQNVEAIVRRTKMAVETPAPNSATIRTNVWRNIILTHTHTHTHTLYSREGDSRVVHFVVEIH